jgi:hypothetical protein
MIAGLGKKPQYRMAPGSVVVAESGEWTDGMMFFRNSEFLALFARILQSSV